MEMPLYHLPNSVQDRPARLAVDTVIYPEGWHEHFGDGSVDLGVSALPGGNFQTSYLVQFGKFVEPVGSLDGLTGA